MKISAGILLYRKKKLLEVFLVHPGGPYWKNKDESAWSIPKGESEENEELLPAAIREFYEETGITCSGQFMELAPVKQRSTKIVYAWALEKNIDPSSIISNTFEMEWPPKSRRKQTFPEVDKGEWFNVLEARQKINDYQVPLIDQLILLLKI